MPVPIVPLFVAALAGGFAAAVSRQTRQSSVSPVEYYSAAPAGYRRLRKSDRITSEMVIAQEEDISMPYGIHKLHDGFMTGVENPTGQRKVVAIFVPIGTEYVR